jgi:hypothetical protein
MATMDGSFTTIPLPFAYTRVLAVPRSMARSLEKRLKRRLRFMNYRGSLLKAVPKKFDHTEKTQLASNNSFSARIRGYFASART